MPDYVRVRDKSVENATPISIVRSAAEADPDVWEVLDEPAADHNGWPLPPGAAEDVAEDQGYADWTAAELKDEIKARNAGRDESNQIPAQGNKPDLIAALEADNTNQES